MEYDYYLFYFINLLPMTRPLQLLSSFTDREWYLMRWYSPMAVIEIEYDSYDWFDIEIYRYENTSFHSEYCEEKKEEILYSFCVFRDWEYIDNRYWYINKNEVIDRVRGIIQDNK